MGIFIGKDMPESMYPPASKPITTFVLTARGTGYEPCSSADKFLSKLASRVGVKIVWDVVEFHRLHFFGKPLTRERLTECLRMKFGRTWLDQLQ